MYLDITLTFDINLEIIEATLAQESANIQAGSCGNVFRYLIKFNMKQNKRSKYSLPLFTYYGKFYNYQYTLGECIFSGTGQYHSV